LVKNDSLVNEMLDYYERKVYACEEFDKQAQLGSEKMNARSVQIFSTKSFDFVSRATDSTWNDEVIKADSAQIVSVKNDNSLKLLSYDKNALEMLHTEIQQFQWSLIFYDRFLNLARNSAVKLIRRIEEVY
jgi:hypothetical protein